MKKTIILFSILCLPFLASAQSKFNFQVTGGYSISGDWNVNGYNIDLSINRKIGKFFSLGFYYDVSAVNNYIPQINQTGEYYTVPPALDRYILSNSTSDFSQIMDNFSSLGVKTNFDINIAKKFKAGFYAGMGITKRVESSLFLSELTFTNGELTGYKMASWHTDATELSFRYGFKLTYELSQRINLIFQAGHNTSKYKKYEFNTTTYDKANLGIALKF